MDIKQKAREMLREVKDPNDICFVSYLGSNEIKALERYSDQIIDLAIAERDKEVVEIIKKYGESRISDWMNDWQVSDIIEITNLITNSNK